MDSKSTTQFFFRHPLMEKYRWYWRIEYGFRRYMRTTYSHSFSGRTFISTVISDSILLSTWRKTIKFTHSLSRCTSSRKLYQVFGAMSKVGSELWLCLNLHSSMLAIIDFIKLHPEYLAKDNAMRFLSDTGGDTYNLCHCKSYTL